jgi:hypothetical protein
MFFFPIFFEIIKILSLSLILLSVIFLIKLINLIDAHLICVLLID